MHKELNGITKLEKRLKSIVFQALEYQNSSSTDDNNSRYSTCWNMYYSNIDNEDYNYLNRFGDYYIPAKVPFNSILKDTIDRLCTMYTRRPFIFSIATVDGKSIDNKNIKKNEEYLKIIDSKVKQKNDEIQTMRLEIEREKMKLQEILSQQPINEEEALQLEQLKQNEIKINAQINASLYLIERELELSNEEMELIENNFKYSFKDLVEIKSEKALKMLKDKLSIESENYLSFKEQLISGAPYIFVDYDEDEKKYIYKSIPAKNVFCLTGSDERFSDEGNVQILTENLSLTNVILKYGKYLTRSELSKLGYNNNNSNNDATPIRDSYRDRYYINSGSNQYRQQHSVCVKRIFIKVSESIYYRIFNDIQGNLHIIDENNIEDKENCDDLKQRFLNKTYELVLFNDDILIFKGRRKVQDDALRQFDDMSYAQLPIIGYNFNYIDKSPDSLIWTTKDLQSLYNIICYHEEYLLAVSGVPSILMDKSQFPEGMTPEQWNYERKLGVTWIQTIKKSSSINGRKSNFNTWQTLDSGISSSIQYLEMMKQNIKFMVDSQTGLNRQAKGETTQYDSVGTTQAAIESSSLVTDIIYYNHDTLVKRALLRILRLWNNIDGKKQQVIQFLDDENILDIEEIPENTLNIADIDIIIKNNNEELRKMSQLQQFATTEFQRAGININDLSKIFNAKTVNEMEKKLDIYVKNAIELRQQESQSMAEAEQLKSNIEHELKAQELKLKEASVKIEEMKVAYNNNNEQMKLQLEDQKQKSDSFTKILDTLTERDVELQYLDEQKRASTVSELQNDAQIILNTSLKEKEINNKKIENTVKKNTKERIKD